MASIRNYKLFQVYLNAAGMKEHKEELIRSYSKGRTNSLKELEDKEFAELLEHLKAQTNQIVSKEVLNQKRRKLIAIMADMGYVKDGKPDMESIYLWVIEKGCYKPKWLNDYTKEELSDLIYQAQKIKDFYEEKEKISDIVNSL